MKTTPICNCQSCGKGFADGDIVYLVQLDNNIVCPVCAAIHPDRKQRLVEIETTCDAKTTRLGAMMCVLGNGGVALDGREMAFLDWIAGWDQETVDTLGRLLEKCLEVGGNRE